MLATFTTIKFNIFTSWRSRSSWAPWTSWHTWHAPSASRTSLTYMKWRHCFQNISTWIIEQLDLMNGAVSKQLLYYGWFYTLTYHYHLLLFLRVGPVVPLVPSFLAFQAYPHRLLRLEAPLLFHQEVLKKIYESEIWIIKPVLINDTKQKRH